jgi:PKD repeat protein
MYDLREMIRMFLKGRLAAVPLVVLILLLVTACSLLNSPPVASFSVFPNSGSAPLVVSFDASSSSDTSGIIVAYQWEFGDGITGSGKVKTHTYKLPGQYTARLTVTDDDGAKDLTIQTIQVHQAAITASFVANPTSGESPLSVDFDASSSFDPDGESITYAWRFGDGATGNGVVAGHTYYTAGIYAVLLTVRNGSGDQDQATATIAVSEASQVSSSAIRFEGHDSTQSLLPIPEGAGSTYFIEYVGRYEDGVFMAKFKVVLLDALHRPVGALVNTENGSFEGRREGNGKGAFLDVTAVGSWAITIVGGTTEAPPQTYTGCCAGLLSQYSPLFTLDPGRAAFYFDEVDVVLLDYSRNTETPLSREVDVLGGAYLLKIRGGGCWEVSVEQ